MFNRNIRIPVVVLAIVVVLAALFLGQMIYKKYNIEQPLFKVYSKTKAVQNVDIINQDGQVKVILQLGPTDSLQKVYQEVLEQTNKVVGQRTYDLEIKDKRNASLEELFVDVEPVLYEAISKGSYTWMRQEILTQAQTKGIKARVFMDGERIYLAFAKDRNYLYEVIKVNQGPVTPGSSKGSDNDA